MGADFAGFAAGAGAIAQGIGALTSNSPKFKNQTATVAPQRGFSTPSFAFVNNQLFRRPGGAFGTDGIPSRQAELLGFTRSLRDPLTSLQGDVKPGFGRLSQIASTVIRERGAAAVGNLRSNLSRRGVLGSSFGADAVSRTQAEFAQQEQFAQAQAFVQEIAAQTGLSQVLIQQAQAESAQIGQQIQTELAEFGIAADLLSQVRIGAFDSAIGTEQINALRAELGLPPITARKSEPLERRFRLGGDFGAAGTSAPDVEQASNEFGDFGGAEADR